MSKALRDKLPPEKQRMTVTLGDTCDVVEAVISPLLDQIAGLQREVAELKKCAASNDKIALQEMRIEQLTRACDANRKHCSNLESKIAKSQSTLKGMA